MAEEDVSDQALSEPTASRRATLSASSSPSAVSWVATVIALRASVGSGKAALGVNPDQLRASFWCSRRAAFKIGKLYEKLIARVALRTLDEAFGRRAGHAGRRDRVQWLRLGQRPRYR